MENGDQDLDRYADDGSSGALSNNLDPTAPLMRPQGYLPIETKQAIANFEVDRVG
ncbi:MAG: hypothetical protein WBM86_20825 [Waterburya sp.]